MARSFTFFSLQNGQKKPRIFGDCRGSFGVVARDHHHLHARSAKIVYGGARFGAKLVAKHGKRKQGGVFRHFSLRRARVFSFIASKGDHAPAKARLLVQAFFDEREIELPIAFAVEIVRKMRQ